MLRLKDGKSGVCYHQVTSADYQPGSVKVRCEHCGKTGEGANRALAEYNMKYAGQPPISTGLA